MQQLLMRVTQLHSPWKRFEHVSPVLRETDLEGLVLGSNSQNSNIICNLIYKSFWSSLVFIIIVRFSFAFSIMLLKIIYSLLMYCFTTHQHSELILRISILYFELVFFGSFISRWKKVKMRLFLQPKIALGFCICGAYRTIRGRNTLKLKNSMFCYKHVTIFRLKWKKYVNYKQHCPKMSYLYNCWQLYKARILTYSLI